MEQALAPPGTREGWARQQKECSCHKIKDGPVSKKNAHAITLSRWSRRWLFLFNDLLLITTVPSPRFKVKALVPLKETTIKELPDKDGKFCFEVTCGGKTWTLSAQSMEARSRWHSKPKILKKWLIPLLEDLQGGAYNLLFTAADYIAQVQLLCHKQLDQGCCKCEMTAIKVEDFYVQEITAKRYPGDKSGRQGMASIAIIKRYP
eukprot:g6174.t1